MSGPTLTGAFFATLRRELQIAARRRSDYINPLVFFLMVCSLFPLGVGPDPARLAVLAPGILWVVALLACLLSTDTLLRSDFDDGSLEQMQLSPSSLYVLVLAKTLTHWLLSGFPLALLAPLLGVLLNLPAEGYPALLMGMVIGTPTLSLVGAIGASLTVGLRRGGLLLSLLVLPLYIPVLIFGVSAVVAAVDGFAYGNQLALLGALTLLAISLAPLAIAAGVRISNEN